MRQKGRENCFLTVKPALTNLQTELLKLYALDVEEAHLLKIRAMLGQYFAQEAIALADKAWDERGYTNESMLEWVQNAET